MIIFILTQNQKFMVQTFLPKARPLALLPSTSRRSVIVTVSFSSIYFRLFFSAQTLHGVGLAAAGVSSQSAEDTGSIMASRQRNSVRILSSRERGSQIFGSQRLLQLLVEEKVRWMKWQSQASFSFFFPLRTKPFSDGAPYSLLPNDMLII